MMKRRNATNTRNEDSDENSDEIYDEIDRFHMQSYDGLNESKLKESKVEEILNVEGDLSENDTLDEENDSLFDSDDNDVEKRFLPSTEEWGANRKNYYSTSYVDDDWGGMNENEIEVAELEEQDAIMRQKKMDTALQLCSYFQVSEDEDEKKDLSSAISLDEMNEEGLFKYFLKYNPEFNVILEEYSRKRLILIRVLIPLLNGIKEIDNGTETVLGQQVLIAVSVFSSYLLNILFYCHLKLTTKLSVKKNYLDDHPVLDNIMMQKKMIEKVGDFLANNQKALGKLQRLMEKKQPFIHIFELSDDISNHSKKDSYQHESNNPEELKKEILLKEENFGKRGITSQIQKNRGLSTFRKKGTQHSRVKKRKQFKKALLKKRSQQPDIRDQYSPYGGEPRGIRASTVKSIKLKA